MAEHAFQPRGEHLANKCFIVRVHAACQLLEEVHVVFLLNELDALRVKHLAPEVRHMTERCTEVFHTAEQVNKLVPVHDRVGCLSGDAYSKQEALDHVWVLVFKYVRISF